MITNTLAAQLWHTFARCDSAMLRRREVILLAAKAARLIRNREGNAAARQFINMYRIGQVT